MAALKNFHSYINAFSEINTGNKFFLLGIVLLPSALPFGLLFLLISLIICFPENKKKFLKDRWNIPVLLSIGIIIVSTLSNTVFNNSIELVGFDKSLVWINLSNWIPILIFFHSFQEYLGERNQRINFIKALIIGTFPVIVSCILQAFFKIYGPFEILNGLIIWFQKPIPITGGISGLFSNPNYLAFWFSIVLPFTLIFQRKNKNNFQHFFLFLINGLIIIFLLMTNSRNGLLSLAIISFYFLNTRKIFLIIFGISSFVFFANVLKLPFLIDLFSGNTLFQKIIDFNTNIHSNPRIIIWKNASELISQKPLFGWGASTFPFLNENLSFDSPLKFINAQHTHNMPLELAHNFGIPLSLLIFSTLIILFLKVIQEFKKNLKGSRFNFDRCWVLSSIIIIFLHLSDITYYDGKISIIICIFFSGMRSILREYQSKINT